MLSDSAMSAAMVDLPQPLTPMTMMIRLSDCTLFMATLSRNLRSNASEIAQNQFYLFYAADLSAIFTF